MKPETRRRLYLVLISLMLQGTAIGSFLIWKSSHHVQASSFSDILFLSLISCVFSILLLIENDSLTFTLLVLRTISFLLLCILLKDEIALEILMLISTTIEIAMCVPQRILTLFSILPIGLGTVFQLPSEVLEIQEFPGVPAVVSFAAVGIATAAISFLYRLESDRLREAVDDIDKLNSAVLQLTSANTGFLQYATTIEQRSTESERNRITRELHDIVGQTFTNIIMMMNAVIRHQDKTEEELCEIHEWIRSHAQSGLQEVRAVLYELRAIREGGVTGIQAIMNLADTFEKSTDVRVEIEWNNLPYQSNPELDRVLFRVIQEAMVNAFRHGRATLIKIQFWYDGHGVNLSVHDNGTGSVKSKKGLGQMGMEERVGRFGGRIEFLNVPDGYKVLAWIPLPETTREVVDEAAADPAD
jgi:signal transduction histidine kinase